MAALAANVVPMPRPDPATPVIERTYLCDAADTFYLGCIPSVKNADGHIYLDNADADWGLGFCTKKVVTAAQDDPVVVAITGIWWITAAACANASLLQKQLHPLAGSDNPADVTATAATNCGGLGLLVHVDATGVSGWINLDIRNIPTNS